MNQCINPDEIRAGDLSAHADGEAGPQIVEHVRRCAFCQAQVTAYHRMQAILVVALDRAACPVPDVLGDYYLNALPAGKSWSWRNTCASASGAPPN